MLVIIFPSSYSIRVEVPVVSSPVQDCAFTGKAFVSVLN